VKIHQKSTLKIPEDKRPGEVSTQYNLKEMWGNVTFNPENKDIVKRPSISKFEAEYYDEDSKFIPPETFEEAIRNDESTFSIRKRILKQESNVQSWNSSMSINQTPIQPHAPP